MSDSRNTYPTHEPKTNPSWCFEHNCSKTFLYDITYQITGEICMQCEKVFTRKVIVEKYIPLRVNPITGEINLKYNPQNIQEDYFLYIRQ